MESTVLGVVLLCCVYFCCCEDMVDPHNMFDVFNSDQDDQIDDSGDKILDHSMKKTDSSSGPSKYRLKTSSGALQVHEPCSQFLGAVLNNVNNQVGDGNLDVSIQLSLTPNDVLSLKNLVLNSKEEESKVCLIMLESMERSVDDHWVWSALSRMRGFFAWLMDLLSDIKFYVRHLIRLSVKDFVLFSWLMIGLIFLFVVLVLKRSVAVGVSVMFFSMLFLSTYTTYHRRYQEAVAERESLLLTRGKGVLPAECLNPVKSHWHKFMETFTGPQPVGMSDYCRNFYRKLNVDAEVEVKLSDAFAETFFGFFGKIIDSIFDSAHSISSKVSSEYSFWWRWTIQGLVFCLVLLFGLIVIGQLFGQEFSTYFFTLRPSSNRTHHPIGHREIIENLPLSHSVTGGQRNETEASVSAEWLHRLLERQAQSIEDKVKKSSTKQESDSMILDSSGLGRRKTTSTRGCKSRPDDSLRPGFKKLQSAVALRPQPSKELVQRRMSF